MSKTKIDVSTVEAAENTEEEVVVLSPEGNGDERQQEQPEEGEIQVRITAVLRILDVYPGSRIQKRQQKRGVKKNLVIPLYVATNFTKLKIILVLKWRRKQFGPNFK